MLIIDENISEHEVWRLREWGITVRRIGAEIAAPSIADENIIPILHHLKHPTFFSRDQDFWKVRLAHPNYCLVFLDIPEHEGEIALAIRRFLRHSDFNSHAKRMGKVVRLHLNRIHYWQLSKQFLSGIEWNKD
jgi:hypothetical protein